MRAMNVFPASRFKRAALATGALLILLVSVQWVLLDGIDGFLWSRFIEAPTEYAPGYSDWRFRRVRLGDSKAEVLGQLGEPLAKIVDTRAVWPQPVEYWLYSRSATDSSHRRRQIVFDTAGGLVIAKQSFLDVD
jgi:hypothetical protein